MQTPHRLLLLSISMVFFLLPGCSTEIGEPPTGAPVPDVAELTGRGNQSCHATGEVDLIWKGSANAPTGAHGDSTKVAAAVFDAHEAAGGIPAKGTFRYRVLALDGTLHREVTAAIEGVVVDPAERRVWMVGRVTADTKGCTGGPGGGHDSGCGDDTEGGCSDGHDDGHDGGCSGDHEEGGCTDGGGSHDDGGCPDGSHDDGGCPEGSHDTGGGSGGPSGATGRTCRVGQMIVVKAHDGGSPGAPFDGITWKWFLADDPDLPSITDLGGWPHLCRKTITGGNLAIHVPGRGNGLTRDEGQ